MRSASANRSILSCFVGGAAILVGASCGGPGLPPAGPQPGQVDVGYDTQPASDVTGSVTTLSTREFAGSKPTGLIEILRGRVPGLQISQGSGGGFILRIRGIGSLTSDMPPLLVIDGVNMSSTEADNALAGISSDDVVQVDVLKDIASTSIYGMSGAGGVIIVNTRR